MIIYRTVMYRGDTVKQHDEKRKTETSSADEKVGESCFYKMGIPALFFSDDHRSNILVTFAKPTEAFGRGIVDSLVAFIALQST